MCSVCLISSSLDAGGWFSVAGADSHSLLLEEVWLSGVSVDVSRGQ